MIIVVTDPSNVSVDGVESGSITDVLENYKNIEGIRSLALAALEEYSNNLKSSHAKELSDTSERIQNEFNNQIQTLKLEHESFFASQESTHTQEIQTLKQKNSESYSSKCENHKAECTTYIQTINSLKKTIAEQEQIIEALGGTTVGKAKAIEEKRKSLEEAKAKIEADIQALEPT